MMLKCLTPVAFASVIVLFSATAQAQDADQVMANVNGTDITLGHMVQAFEELPAEYQGLPTDVLWRGILDQLIQQSLLADTATNTESKRVTVALENEKRGLLAQSAIADVSEAALTDAALQAAYDAAYADGGSKEYNASHILVETEEAANELTEQARGGEDFAALARQHSTGPSGPNGGELGWFGEGRMVPEFEMAVKEMDVGAVSEPVQTQFGWHVIKLNETRIQEAPELDAVRDQLSAEIQTSAIEARIGELMQAAEITRTAPEEIDTELLKKSDLLD